MDHDREQKADDLLAELDAASSGEPVAEPTTIACELREVSVVFDEEQVLHDVSIAFPAGEVTMIMGPSGSGKSTLLKAAAGLAVPDSGSVRILGMDPSRATDRDLEALRARNGFVFQDGALWQNMTLYQNLALPLQYHRPELGASAVRDTIHTLALELGVTQRLNLRPAQVSAGERKVVSLIRAIVNDPELIFMDEPTTSVDNERIELVIRKLRELKESRKTIIAVTHNARIASQIADNVVVLKNGAILRFGTLRDVSRSGDPEVERILTDVLSETATYDGDILELLDPDTNPFLR